jgi:hypothetical protein
VDYGINGILYGFSKQGKSTLADTTPAPRLILDAEMGSRFTPSRKIVWDPIKYAPPVYDGTWDAAIVPVHDYRTVLRAYEWLNKGDHPFKSVVLDSLSEIQQRCVDSIAGTEQMTTTRWGELLRVVSDLVRKFRDLTTNPIKPMDAVIFIAMARQRDDGVWRPHVQGSLATVLPYYVDLCCFLQIVVLEDGVSTARRLFIGPTPGYETGERVGGRLGPYIDDANITSMLATIRGDDNGNSSSILNSTEMEG